MTAPRPDQILVVIPALNEARHIEACILSLITPVAGFDVVVADGGSSDGTQGLVAALQARYPPLRLVDNPARLQSAGVNRAVDQCAGPQHRYLVRCDAHAAYPPGYIMAVAAGLDTHGAASVVVPMDAGGRTGFGRAAGWIVDTPLGSGGAAHRGGRKSGFVDHGHHAGMDLHWFRHIGGYDTTFSHNEDADYDHRLRQGGGTIWLDANVRLDYVMRPTFTALARQYWNYGRGRARSVMKHRMRPRLRQMIPVVNLLGMGLAIFVSAVWPAAIFWPMAYLMTLFAVSVAGAWALRGLQGFWAGPALLAMHNAWAAGFLWQIIRRPT